MALSSYNVLVRCSISTYDGVVKDKKVSAEIKRSKGSTEDSGNFYKKLMPFWISQINQIVGKARTAHYRMTAPWDKRGRDILPNKKFFEYEATMIPLQSQFFDLVKQFEKVYDQQVLDDAVRLNSMYDVGDYKSKRALKHARYRQQNCYD